ncbi:Tol-Pal system beta propeller repeat protein TolB [Coxiella burnetii]|uniref:Tol-Pal system beta propeller repeat protein TolB n=1 Tax=Coxiella burnetii TaxID=777 RepID=UPI002175D989|nr:Tol-Pal system beta propeller repeat protein TolB [Coxiella burnetii]
MNSMQKRHPIIFLLITLLIFVPVSYGALDLELTKGVTAAIPIAIMPFAGPSVLAPGDETIPQVIKNDLQNSGQFRVTGSGNLDQTAASLEQIDYSYWRKQKVNALVVGAINPLGMRRYRVAFTLINVFDSNNRLLSESFNVNAKELRNLAHHISDLIYQKLTGVRGVFSTKIAYVLVQASSENTAAKYTLEVADADGFNPQPLLVSDMPIMSPTWSPDGNKIAYVSFEGHRAAIYLQDLATGRRQRLSEAPGINGAPAFSPDGKQLALVLTKTGNPKIYILNLADGHLREITKGWSIDTEPAWSPDGKSLLFTSNRDGTPQIYNYSFADGSINRVTYRGDYNARPSFMPDGKSIIMMHRENGLFGIARQDLSTGQVQILSESGTDESPSLAPNGKMAIYAMEYGGRGVLAQVSIDGQIKLRLPARNGNVQEPAWSPYLGV